MNFVDRHRRYNLYLAARNEGKLKSHESCTDIRAWSHDCRRRARYLREWIKSDMPLCILPVSTLVGFFRAMTCRRNRPNRCHPDCKSRVILESITASCVAMKECMKADENLQKFFVEEEIETSHWPCERYLDALKSIKLFWRIMLEKVFLINLTKSECFEKTTGCATDSVRDVARNWQRDMVHETQFVRNITPRLLCATSQTSIGKPCHKKDSCYRIPGPCSEGDARNFSNKASKITYTTSKKCMQSHPLKNNLFERSSHCNIQRRCSRSKSCSSTSLSKDYQTHKHSADCERQECTRPKSCPYSRRIDRLSKTCQTSVISLNTHKWSSSRNSSSKLSARKKCSSINCRFIRKARPYNGSSRSTIHSKHYKPLHLTNSKSHECSSCKPPPAPSVTSRCMSHKVKLSDACCGTAGENTEANCIKAKMDSLQKMFNKQKQEIEKLKKENCTLKCEVHNMFRNCKLNSVFGSQKSPIPDKDVTVLVPKPFESSIDASSSTNLTKDADSELLITMKNCKHEYFRHVNLLQVLHKSNDPCLQDNYLGGPCYKNEDPIRLLQKVKMTLGAMVTREMALNRQKRCDSSSDIVASFQRVSSSKSEPLSSFSSRCTLNSCRSNKCDRHRLRK